MPALLDKGGESKLSKVSNLSNMSNNFLPKSECTREKHRALLD